MKTPKKNRRRRREENEWKATDEMAKMEHKKNKKEKAEKSFLKKGSMKKLKEQKKEGTKTRSFPFLFSRHFTDCIKNLSDNPLLLKTKSFPEFSEGFSEKKTFSPVI